MTRRNAAFNTLWRADRWFQGLSWQYEKTALRIEFGGVGSDGVYAYRNLGKCFFDGPDQACAGARCGILGGFLRLLVGCGFPGGSGKRDESGPAAPQPLAHDHGNQWIFPYHPAASSCHLGDGGPRAGAEEMATEIAPERTLHPDHNLQITFGVNTPIITILTTLFPQYTREHTERDADPGRRVAFSGCV